MDLDKVLAISLSTAALAFSLVSTLISLHRQDSDRERGIRQDLAKIIQELISAKAEELSLARSGNSVEHEYEYLQRWQALWQRMDVLVRRAFHLIEKRPDLATDVEYAVLAQSFHLSRMWDRAEEAWKEAIRRAADKPDYRHINMRGYADFLFALNRKEQGRAIYREAISSLPANSDTAKHLIGYTYQLWMQLESGDPSRRDECHKQARRQFESISSSALRDDALSYLDRAYTQFVSPKENGSI